MEPLDEAACGLGFVAAVEVGGTEVAVFDAVAQHVVAGGEHRGGHGEDGLLGPPPGFDAEELRAQIAVLLARSRPGGSDESGLEPVGALAHSRSSSLLALSLLRGQRPAQETRCPAEGKRDMSTPIPATITCETMSLTPASSSGGAALLDRCD